MSANVDAEALKTFLAVHRLRSFSKAAQTLHRTQPAISRRVGQLEEALGATLFERGSAPLVLSQAGRVLVPYAERALAAIQDAEHAVRNLNLTNTGPVSMAVVGTLAGRDLSTVLRQFAGRHADVRIELRTARSAEVSLLVRRGEVTIGLRYDHDRSVDLESTLLGAEPLLIACAPDHPLAGRSIRSLADLADEHWLAFPEIPGQREVAASHVFGIFRAAGLGEAKWTPVDSLTAQKRLVEAGFGLALLQQSSVAEELAAGTLDRIRVRDLRAGSPVFVVVRRGGYLSAAARELRQMLIDVYAPTLQRTDDQSAEASPRRAANSGRTARRRSRSRSQRTKVRKM
jgi:DNA-binding transcriptional LysR family regulator